MGFAFKPINPEMDHPWSSIPFSTSRHDHFARIFPLVLKIPWALFLVGLPSAYVAIFGWSRTTGAGSDTNRFLDRVSGRGMICGWSPQVEILAHKAVGGFVSHCGWNSIVESLWFGLPFVTWPMYAEQQLNAFLMVKELKLAEELKLDYRVYSDEIVNANEIENSIRCVMNKDNNVVRKRVMDIAKMARKATCNGGSSYSAIEKFIQDVIGIKP